MQNIEKIIVNDEIAVTLKVIGGKYKPLIIYLLGCDGLKRFGAIMEHMKPISQKTLTNQLRELEADEIITRKIYPEIPPRVEYSITEKGLTLLPILNLMCKWGMENAGLRYEISHPQC